jgi:hypothetical protein
MTTATAPKSFTLGTCSSTYTHQITYTPNADGTVTLTHFQVDTLMHQDWMNGKTEVLTLDAARNHYRDKKSYGWS